MSLSVPERDAERRTALYRLYDAEGVLLYVGVSGNPPARWTNHAATQTWWPEVAKLTLAWFDTREMALDAELRAIGTEHPRHNRPGWNASNTPGPTPRRVIRIEQDLWDEFGRLVGEGNRSAVIREFIRWAIREPGATLPKRPPRPAE